MHPLHLFMRQQFLHYWKNTDSSNWKLLLISILLFDKKGRCASDSGIKFKRTPLFVNYTETTVLSRIQDQNLALH